MLFLTDKFRDSNQSKAETLKFLWKWPFICLFVIAYVIKGVLNSLEPLLALILGQWEQINQEWPQKIRGWHFGGGCYFWLINFEFPENRGGCYFMWFRWFFNFDLICMKKCPRKQIESNCFYFFDFIASKICAKKILIDLILDHIICISNWPINPPTSNHTYSVIYNNTVYNINCAHVILILWKKIFCKN